jgi:hypothetical protein
MDQISFVTLLSLQIFLIAVIVLVYKPKYFWYQNNRGHYGDYENGMWWSLVQVVLGYSDSATAVCQISGALYVWYHDVYKCYPHLIAFVSAGSFNDSCNYPDIWGHNYISVIRSLYLTIFWVLSWSHFCLRKFQHLVTYTFLFVTAVYYVWFIGKDGSVSLHLLIP